MYDEKKPYVSSILVPPFIPLSRTQIGKINCASRGSRAPADGSLVLGRAAHAGRGARRLLPRKAALGSRLGSSFRVVNPDVLGWPLPCWTSGSLSPLVLITPSSAQCSAAVPWVRWSWLGTFRAEMQLQSFGDFNVKTNVPCYNHFLTFANSASFWKVVGEACWKMIRFLK